MPSIECRFRPAEPEPEFLLIRPFFLAIFSALVVGVTSSTFARRACPPTTAGSFSSSSETVVAAAAAAAAAAAVDLIGARVNGPRLTFGADGGVTGSLNKSWTPAPTTGDELDIVPEYELKDANQSNQPFNQRERCLALLGRSGTGAVLLPVRSSRLENHPRVSVRKKRSKRSAQALVRARGFQMRLSIRGDV